MTPEALAGLELDESLAPVAETLADALARVEQRFEAQLESDLPPVGVLCRHIQRYRGKMLRPTLVIVSGLACDARARVAVTPDLVSADHVTLAAVCEMVHMATLVHDDVLDEADSRRRGQTVNRLNGNETAVLLGDYLIAGAYHLCSQLDSQAAALLVARTAMTLCEGELLQLHHRADWSIDEPTYFEIVERKTGALIGLACRLGALASGADEPTAAALESFGRRVGVAFQIQDDILDVTSSESRLGKNAGKDLEKGKLTLPLIHHLENVGIPDRGRSLELVEAAAGSGIHAQRAARELADVLVETDSIRYARATAASLVEAARSDASALPDSPARRFLLAAADAVIARDH